MASGGNIEPLPPWALAVVGSTASVIANTVVYPLDLVKTKIQAQIKAEAGEKLDESQYTSSWDAISKVVQREGPSGLYAGMAGSLIGVASQSFAFWYWYTVVRRLYLSSVTTPPGTIAELSLAAAAGQLAQIFTIPVAVVTTRQQTTSKEERLTMLGTARSIVNSEDGWTGLWRGLKVGLVLSLNPAITHGAQARLRATVFQGRQNLRPWESFLLGMVSKALATVVSQPLIVSKVGLQSKPPQSRKGKPFKTFGEVMAHIIRTEGILHLWKGLGPQLSKAILVQGLLIMIKERIEIMFSLLYCYMRTLRTKQLQKLAAAAAEKGTRGSRLVVTR